MRIVKTLTGLILFISSIAFGQTDFLILHNEREVGKNFIDNSVIEGVEYIFPERIYRTFVDTTNGFLTVQLRGLRNEKWLANKGDILQYDLNEDKLLWRKSIAYQLNRLKQIDSIIIFTTANKSFSLDINTGEKMWKVKKNLFYLDALNRIGLGFHYKSSTGTYSNKLEGIDLTSGDVIWEREINKDYGLNDIFHLNDTTLMLVAAGLHSINLHDGSGWDYHTVSGKKDYSGTIAANAAGMALGLLTGSYFVFTGYNVIRDLVSNATVDSSNIYLASREQLAKINKQNGRIVWMHPFPKGLPSKSSIFIQDSMLVMVNRGYAFKGNRQLYFGKPFIAAFNKETGKQIFLTIMFQQKDPVLSFQLLQDDIYLLFQNKIAKYSIRTGEQILVKEFPENIYGDLQYFTGDNIFVTTKNGNWISLPKADTSKVFVYTSRDEIFTIDRQLEVTNSMEYNDLHISFLNTEDFHFIAHDKQTQIVNKDGKQVAELEVTSNAFLVGKTLYDRQDNKFLTIDMKGIIDHK